MNHVNMELPFTSWPLPPAVAPVLEKLQPGQRIRIHQIVRVGDLSWPLTVEGTFRELCSLATGIATDRDPHDDVIIPLVRFTKDNGELSSVTLDENSRIEILS
jgi:hypothetical protein